MLSKEELIDLYVIKNMTDREIADMYNVDRTRITHKRKQFGISRRESLHEQVLLSIVKILHEKGYDVKNVKQNDRNSNLDILLNSVVKIKIMVANIGKDGWFKYGLTSNRDHVESENRIRLTNGRYRLKYNEMYDFIIFVGIINARQIHWIVPSDIIGDKLQTVSIRTDSNNRFYRYYESWSILSIDSE